MFVPLLTEARLQQSAPGLVNFYTVTCAEAVAENQNSRRLGTCRVRAYQQKQKEKNNSHVGSTIKRKLRS